jgi:hypothetical protein
MTEPLHVSAARSGWFRRVWALSTLLLLWSTWRLWTPQLVFPQVPLFAAADKVPVWLEWAALGGIVTSLACLLLAPRESRIWRIAAIWFAALMLAMFCLDQHRIQPWAWQFVFVALALAFLNRDQSFRYLRLLTLSVYFFSAVSKLDYTFLHGMGQEFLFDLCRFVGIDLETWSDPVRLAGASLFPVGELLVALLLAWPPTRRAGVWFAVALHLLLILMLGPLGAGHKPGVLIWNAFFIPQAYLLFWPTPRTRVSETLVAPRERPGSRRVVPLVKAAIVAAALLPAMEWFGWYDTWPAWGLYAPRSSRAYLFVDRSTAEKFSLPMSQYVETPLDDSPWQRIRLEQWSLNALIVPIYPEERFSLGVAVAVIRDLSLPDDSYRIEILGKADRFTGKRLVATLRNQQQLDGALREYRINADPR